MRLCFYHTETEWSGRARAFVDAAGGLRARGHEVTLVCASGTVVERGFAASGQAVIALRGNGGWLRAGWRLRSVLRTQFVDVVFVHTPRELAAAAVAVRLADRGAVVQRIPPLGRLAGSRRDRLASRLASTGFLYSLDDDLRAARPPAGGLLAAVAPPGIAPAVAGRAGVRDQGVRTIVCLVGGLHRPRVALALRAIALLAPRHPELRAIFVGPRSDDDTLRLQASSLGIGSRVEVMDDPSSRDAIGDSLAGAAVAWVLSDGDELAYAVLDSFSSGVVVVAGDDPLARRFVTSGESGVLATSLDATGWAALLAAQLGETEVRARLVAGARAAAARWPMDAFVDGFQRAAEATRDRARRPV